jgi:hypothetical protein
LQEFETTCFLFRIKKEKIFGVIVETELEITNAKQSDNTANVSSQYGHPAGREQAIACI